MVRTPDPGSLLYPGISRNIFVNIKSRFYWQWIIVYNYYRILLSYRSDLKNQIFLRIIILRKSLCTTLFYRTINHKLGKRRLCISIYIVLTLTKTLIVLFRMSTADTDVLTTMGAPFIIISLASPVTQKKHQICTSQVQVLVFKNLLFCPIKNSYVILKHDTCLPYTKLDYFFKYILLRKTTTTSTT